MQLCIVQTCTDKKSLLDDDANHLVACLETTPELFLCMEFPREDRLTPSSLHVGEHGQQMCTHTGFAPYFFSVILIPFI